MSIMKNIEGLNQQAVSMQSRLEQLTATVRSGKQPGDDQMG